jgi:hypothetical protein
METHRIRPARWGVTDSPVPHRSRGALGYEVPSHHAAARRRYSWHTTGDWRIAAQTLIQTGEHVMQVSDRGKGDLTIVLESGTDFMLKLLEHLEISGKQEDSTTEESSSSLRPSDDQGTCIDRELFEGHLLIVSLVGLRFWVELLDS